MTPIIRLMLAFLFSTTSTVAETDHQMVNAWFDFQTGFAGQSVELLVNNKRVFRKSGLKTDISTGLADQLAIKGEKGVFIIQLIVNGRIVFKQSATIESDTYFGISLDKDNEVILMISRKRFLYD